MGMFLVFARIYGLMSEVRSQRSEVGGRTILMGFQVVAKNSRPWKQIRHNLRAII